MELQTPALELRGATIGPKHTSWQSYCRLGSISSWILLLYSLATMVILVAIGGQPNNAQEAFTMLQQNRLSGLLRLDVLSILVMPLYYVLFLSLFMVLRRQA